MRKSAWFFVFFVALIVMVGCASAPEQERLRAEQALRDAEVVKNCDPARYAEALELFKAAQEAEKKKEFAKAKELYLSAESGLKGIASYYRANPDKCLANKKPEKDEDEEDALVAWDPDDPNNPDMRFPVVRFAFDSYEISPEYADRLARVAKWMENHRAIAIRIEGHTDERGSIDYNMSLGERRADEVRRFLQRHGIDPGRLRILSYGKERPVAGGSHEDAWSQNRRAEVERSNR